MDEELFKATREGDTKALQALIQKDPLILDRTSTTRTAKHHETPLHIAAMLGHVAYAAELLKRKPGLAREVDSTRSTALHLGSAKGDVAMVKELLRVYPDACSVCDKDGRNPLHVAAMMGRIDALKEMMAVRPDAARVVIKHGGGGTILHLCVEFAKFEALKVVMEGVDVDDLVNGKDRDGNTVLHLAVADKQVQTTEYLLSTPGMDLNAVNLKGITAMDILIQRRRDTRDLEMEESLKRGGAIAPNNTSPFLRRSKHKNSSTIDKHKLIKNNQNDWLDKKRSALMVVASLIATMAFQVGVAPPENLWKVTQTPSNTTKTDANNGVYELVRKGNDFLKKGEQFYIINTVSFIASLSTILLLMSGLPLKSRFFVWMLLMITWIAITGIALSYTVAVINLPTPASKEKSINYIVGITVFAWICLMTLLLIGHTVRLFIKIVKVFVRMIKALIRCLFCRRRRRSTTNHSRV